MTSLYNIQVDWSPEKITFSIDDTEIGTITVPDGGFWELGEFEKEYGPGMNNPWEMYGKNAPFNKDFYLVINLAVGGTG